MHGEDPLTGAAQPEKREGPNVVGLLYRGDYASSMTAGREPGGKRCEPLGTGEAHRALLESLATEVRRLRIARGWTQNQLADAAGLRAATISGIERARVNATLRTVAQLAAAFGLAANGRPFCKR
jgi:DNA-binding XRE family transcriptional regulator